MITSNPSSKVFNTSDWDDKSIWPINKDGIPEWPGPRNPGEAVNGQNQTECYFKGLTERDISRDYPYYNKLEWWHVFAARMVFVLAFQVNLDFIFKLSKQAEII